MDLAGKLEYGEEVVKRIVKFIGLTLEPKLFVL